MYFKLIISQIKMLIGHTVHHAKKLFICKKYFKILHKVFKIYKYKYILFWTLKYKYKYNTQK